MPSSGRLVALVGAIAPLGSASGLLPVLVLPSAFLVLLAVMLLAGRLAKAIGRARSMEMGDLRRRLEAIAGRAGVAVAEILVHPERSYGNARILGVTDRTRYVVFTEGLLAKFAPQDLEAAFAHEIGHARRGHPRWLLVFVAAFLLFAYPVEELALDLPSWIGILLILAFFIAWWRSLFGRISRRFEFEADLEAADLIGAGAYGEALRRIEEGGGQARRTYRYPSVQDRSDRLAASAGPGPGRRDFEGRGLRLRRFLIALLAASAAAFVATLAVKSAPD